MLQTDDVILQNAQKDFLAAHPEAQEIINAIIAEYTRKYEQSLPLYQQSKENADNLLKQY
jgi:hypothetical protein